MEHYFGRDDGGAFQTKDLGILTAVPGKPGRFMLEITYDIQPEVTRGTLKGYSGQFNSYGLVDLRDNDNLVGLVRQALFHKSSDVRASPYPRRSSPTGSVIGIAPALVGFQGLAFLRGGITVWAFLAAIASWHLRVSYAPSAVTLPMS